MILEIPLNKLYAATPQRHLTNQQGNKIDKKVLIKYYHIKTK